MVDPAHRHPAQGALLNPREQLGFLFGAGLEILDLPEQVLLVPVGRGEFIGAAIAGVVVDPSARVVRGLDRGDAAVQRLRRGGAPTDNPDTGLVRAGELQRMMIAVLVAPQIARCAVVGRRRHPQNIVKEPEGVLEFRGEEFDHRKLGDIVDLFLKAHGSSLKAYRDLPEGISLSARFSSPLRGQCR